MIFTPGVLSRLGAALGAAGMMLALAACAVNPVSGETELMLLSERQERRLGEQTDEQVVRSYGIYDEGEVTEYVASLGVEIARLSHRPDLRWDFKVMDTPVVNAFAVPGGFVYMTRGILAYLNSEAEMAGVLAHEIGHVTARHSARQYSKAQLAQLGLGLGAALSDTFARFAGVAQAGVQLLFLKFSRDNERQADSLGVEYSTKADYDASEMAEFFRTLERMRGDEGGGALPSWFSTHPDPEDRVGAVRRQAAQWKEKLGPKDWRIAREAYLERTDGLVFGPDPRQGYAEAGAFYHPGLRLQFPIPAGWKVQNTPSQVQIAAPDEAAAVLFTLGSRKTVRAEADTFVSRNEPEVLARQDLRIHGMDAHRLSSRLRTDSGLLRILSTFVRKGRAVFVFHGLSVESRFESYRPEFERTMNGLRELTDPDRLNVKPDRIRVVRTRQRGALRQALRSFGAPESDWRTLELINGMELDRVLPEGTAIKTVEAGR